MPKVIEEFPEFEFTPILTLPQMRVLEVLYPCRGPITRRRIMERMGYIWPTTINDAIGSSDPEKRVSQRFTNGKSGPKRINLGTPLLTLGYVMEKLVDVDGLIEKGVRITQEGKKAYEDHLQKDPRYKDGVPALKNPGKRRVKTEPTPAEPSETAPTSGESTPQ